MSFNADDVPVVSRKRESIISLIFVGLSILVTIFQGIILTPVYLKYISAELFGAWLATGNVIAWISMVDPGLCKVMQQRVAIAFGKRDFQELRAILGTGLFIGTFLSLLPLLAIPFSGMIAGTLNISPVDRIELENALRLGLVGTTLNIASFQPSSTNLGLQNSFATGSSHILATLVAICCSYFMLVGGYGLAAIPAGIIVRGGLLLILNGIHLAIWCSRNLKASLIINREQIRKYSSLSVFVFFERLGGVFVSQSEAYLVATMLAPQATAVCALSSRAFDPIRPIGERLSHSFLPGMSHLAGEGKVERAAEIGRRILNVSAFIGSVGAASVLALNEAFVKIWVGEALFGGQYLTAALSISLIMGVLLNNLAEMVFAVGGVGQIEIMRAVEGLVRVGIQFLILRYIGILGIPVGAILGTLLVSAWYLPRLAARHLGGTVQSRYWSLFLFALQGLVLLACGMGIWFLTKLYITHWTLLRFLGAAAIVGPLITLVGLAINPPMRVEFQALRRSLKTHFERQKK